jgi:N-acetylmuramoyl-L-alanine amidase
VLKMGLFGLLAMTFVSAPVICIEPGHPSEVGRGTSGKQISELHAAWLVAVDLTAKLEVAGYTVVLTKASENQLVKNPDRAKVANQAHAALMVRLHCDANDGSGFAVYYPDRAGKIGSKTGPSQEVLKRTQPLAQTFHARLAKELQGKLADNGLKSDIKTAVGSRYGALIGSIYSEVPTVLVEMVNLKNPKDEKFIVSSAGRVVMANALLKAIEESVPLRD